MSDTSYQHTDLTNKIIKAFYEVYNELGYGFLENTYENAMVVALRALGLKVQQQAPVDVYFRGVVVGQYKLDLIVNDLIVVELKAAKSLNADHEAQLLNYLKATHYEVGLLLNFGVSPEIKRKAFSNDRKGSLNWARS